MRGLNLGSGPTILLTYLIFLRFENWFPYTPSTFHCENLRGVVCCCRRLLPKGVTLTSRECIRSILEYSRQILNLYAFRFCFCAASRKAVLDAYFVTVNRLETTGIINPDLKLKQWKALSEMSFFWNSSNRQPR